MPTRTLVVGTHNAKKCAEMRQILAGLPVEVRPLSDFPDVPPAEETGQTFEANARIKAVAYARATGLWCVADDSGLAVDALDGRPGIHSARWAGAQGDDAANNRKLLEELRDVPPERRAARYVCVAVLANAEGHVLAETRGTCQGRILDAPSGHGGFGYDPLFYVAEHGCTMAELPPEQKHAISHRGAALRQLRPAIEALLKE